MHTDLALTLLKRLQAQRADLRVIVMSATLDAEPVAAFLGAERLSCEGRAYPVEIRHAVRPDDRPLAQRVAEALADGGSNTACRAHAGVPARRGRYSTVSV